MSRGNNYMREGIKTWPHASGWPVRGSEAAASNARSKMAPSKPLSPQGWAGLALPSPALFLHSTASVDIGDVGFGSGFPKGGLRANTYFQP